MLVRGQSLRAERQGGKVGSRDPLVRGLALHSNTDDADGSYS